MAKKSTSIGVTAFLDLLGFKDRVLSAHDTAAVDAIAKDVRKIQAEFDYKPKDTTTREIQAHYEKTVLAFTDCVVVNVPLQSAITEQEGTFDALMSELSGMAFAQGRCVSSGLFLRGGIDLGWWHRRGSTLISQSMVRAYKAENQANVPVIALTEELYRYLSEHNDRNFYSEAIEPVRHLLRRYQRKAPSSDVSFWYLDYITIFAESIDWITSRSQFLSCKSAAPGDRQKIMEKGYKRNLTTWFNHHARTIEKAHAKSKVECVKSKYVWLASYHNEIAPKFTTSRACLCRIT
jgi:hypothetical protein